MRHETTILLVGKTGHGKSATGNTILRQKIFRSAASVSAVTKSFQMGSSELEDGRLLRVIDSPGFLDPASKAEKMCKKIARGIQLMSNGIDVVFMVVSLRNRFSSEDMEIFQLLVSIFGDDILKYTCVLFTGGDGDGTANSDSDPDSDSDSESDSTVKDALERMVQFCHGRKIVVDNVTTCEQKQLEQRKQLLNMIESISQENGGIPFSNDLIEKVKARQWVLSVKSDSHTLSQNDMYSEEDFDDGNSHTRSKDDDADLKSLLMIILEKLRNLESKNFELQKEIEKLKNLERKNSELQEEIEKLMERLRKCEAKQNGCSLL